MVDLRSSLAFTTAAAVAVAAHGQSCFRMLDPEFAVWALSADGRTVLGSYGSQAALCDSSSGEITLLPLAGTAYSICAGITADHRTVVGVTGSGEASIPVVWLDGVATFPDAPGAALSSAYRVSGDGSVVLGAALQGPYGPDYFQGYTWRGGPPISLPLLPDAEFAAGYGISPDGRTIVGAAVRTSTPWFTKAVAWWDNGPPAELLPTWVWSRALAATPDGRVIVGTGTDGSWYVGGPFRWSAGFGATLLPCPAYSIYTEVEANSVSNNGEVITMWAFGPEEESLLWTAAAGTRNVFDVLERAGCIGPEWQWWWGQGEFWVSADGRTLAGQARGLVGQEVRQIPWVAVLPPELVCYANCDSSTESPALNIIDFICFQERFATGDTYANCDGSTTPPVLNVNDFVCFLRAFSAGCG